MKALFLALVGLGVVYASPITRRDVSVITQDYDILNNAVYSWAVCIVSYNGCYDAANSVIINLINVEPAIFRLSADVSSHSSYTAADSTSVFQKANDTAGLTTTTLSLLNPKVKSFFHRAGHD